MGSNLILAAALDGAPSTRFCAGLTGEVHFAQSLLIDVAPC